MKTKLGISVALLGAITYMAALVGGYVPVLLIAGYVLLMEENEWLKKAVVQALIVMICFSFAVEALSLVPDILGWISSVLGVFGGRLPYGFISDIFTVITRALRLVEDAVFLVLSLKALNQGTLKLPFIDQMMEKHM